MCKDEIIFIAPLPALSKRTRLAKMIPVIRARGLSIRFFGWEREKGEMDHHAHSDPDVVENRLMRGGGYASGKARLLYLVWMIVVFWRVLTLGRGAVIFALGWETAFPARLAAIFTGASIVFDDADRFSMILRLPSPLHQVLQRAERWVSRMSVLHIVPGLSRYEWHHERMVVLRNTPLEADFNQAKRSARKRPDADLVLYANGWIGETRGAPVFLEALEQAEEADISVAIILAGRVDGPSAPRLVEHPLVTYVGEVAQTEALSYYPAADAVLSFYDPDIPINRKAESNKWGDAVYFDCPIIVNSEVETARAFVNDGAAWSVPYRDTSALVALWRRLATAPEQVEVGRQALQGFKESYLVFDLQFDKILSTVLNKDHDS